MIWVQSKTPTECSVAGAGEEHSGNALCILAINIGSGGGINHLREFIANINPLDCGFTRVYIIGGERLQAHIPDRPWLTKVKRGIFERGLILRSLWQIFFLDRLLRRLKVSVLFVPGGVYLGMFRPYFVMSQNMLPFQPAEIVRYGLTLMAFKLLVLRFLQIYSFRLSSGIIFISEYAKNIITQVAGLGDKSMTVIEHGVGEVFRNVGKVVRRPQDSPRDLNLTYLSTIDMYKHQWTVIEAVSRLRDDGIDVKLNLIGGVSNNRAWNRVERAIRKFDPKSSWIYYFQFMEHRQILSHLARTDVSIFASTCENMPTILLELMSAGQCIICSKFPPMPDILGETGVYFDPLSVDSLYKALAGVTLDTTRRERFGQLARVRSKRYDWSRAANDTLSFLADGMDVGGKNV